MAELTITAANVKTLETDSTYLKFVQFGEAVTHGQAVYKSSSDNKYYLADADSATKPAEAISLCKASADGYGHVQNGGSIDVGATLTVGTSYYAGTTAGAIGVDADVTSTKFPHFIGIAYSASRLDLKFISTGVAKP